MIAAERFPEVDRATIDRLVRDTYSHLLADAEVETHVLSLTRSQVTDRLLAEGHHIQHAQ